MTVGNWITVGLFVLAALWTVLVVWPFMRVTKDAAVKGLEAANKNAKLLAEWSADVTAFLAGARELVDRWKATTARVDAERLERILVNLERGAAAARDPFGAAPRAPAIEAPRRLSFRNLPPSTRVLVIPCRHEFHADSVYGVRLAQHDGVCPVCGQEILTVDFPAKEPEARHDSPA